MKYFWNKISAFLLVSQFVYPIIIGVLFVLMSQELKIKFARMIKLGMTQKYLKKRSDFAYLRYFFNH